MQRTSNRYDLWTLSAVWQTVMVNSSAFRHATVTLIASGSANLTIKCFASNMETQPDLSASASATNEYAAQQITDLNTGSGIDGTTWVVYAGSSDWITRYEVNDNNNDWIWFKVTARTAGSVQIKIDMASNW